ncbi:MAG TPA: hypothetical protein VLJ17_16070 [Xanthobacteraceae bacterium]|nr:hypothetical protein [Xanthobacteraceae bacterium]
MIGSRGGVVGSDGLFWAMRRSCVIDEFEKNRPIDGDSCQSDTRFESRDFPFEIKSEKI